jgi:hypothetical protein
LLLRLGKNCGAIAQQEKSRSTGWAQDTDELMIVVIPGGFRRQTHFCVDCRAFGGKSASAIH